MLECKILRPNHRLQSGYITTACMAKCSGVSSSSVYMHSNGADDGTKDEGRGFTAHRPHTYEHVPQQDVTIIIVMQIM